MQLFKGIGTNAIKKNLLLSTGRRMCSHKAAHALAASAWDEGTALAAARPTGPRGARQNGDSVSLRALQGAPSSNPIVPSRQIKKPPAGEAFLFDSGGDGVRITSL